VAVKNTTKPTAAPTASPTSAPTVAPTSSCDLNITGPEEIYVGAPGAKWTVHAYGPAQLDSTPLLVEVTASTLHVKFGETATTSDGTTTYIVPQLTLTEAAPGYFTGNFTLGHLPQQDITPASGARILVTFAAPKCQISAPNSTEISAYLDSVGQGASLGTGAGLGEVIKSNMEDGDGDGGGPIPPPAAVVNPGAEVRVFNGLSVQEQGVTNVKGNIVWPCPPLVEYHVHPNFGLPSSGLVHNGVGRHTYDCEATSFGQNDADTVLVNWTEPLRGNTILNITIPSNIQSAVQTVPVSGAVVLTPGSRTSNVGLTTTLPLGTTR
jgi:hypothetical protein